MLKGGVVLTMDPAGGDYAKADVRIEGSKIVAIGPNLGGDGATIDCTGMIVMPGFINTHHHQYYAIQRAVIADGLLTGNLAAGNLQLSPLGHLDDGPACGRRPDHLGLGTIAVRS